MMFSAKLHPICTVQTGPETHQTKPTPRWLHVVYLSPTGAMNASMHFQRPLQLAPSLPAVLRCRCVAATALHPPPPVSAIPLVLLSHMLTVVTHVSPLRPLRSTETHQCSPNAELVPFCSRKNEQKGHGRRSMRAATTGQCVWRGLDGR